MEGAEEFKTSEFASSPDSDFIELNSKNNIFLWYIREHSSYLLFQLLLAVNK
jgi:hypothetical protein